MVLAGRVHRELSKDTLVRPPHAAGGATDARVLALNELDQALHAAAATTNEPITSGGCCCDDESYAGLISAMQEAHALLHGTFSERY